MTSSSVQLVVAMSPEMIFQGHGIAFEEERDKKDGGRKKASAKFGSVTEGRM